MKLNLNSPALAVAILMVIAHGAAADDYQPIDCAQSKITIDAGGEIKCGKGQDNISFTGNSISMWRAESHEKGRYLGAFLNRVETSSVAFAMVSLDDAHVMGIAYELHPISHSESRWILGVKQIAFTTNDGFCAVWRKGDEPMRGGQYGTLISGIFCTPKGEELTDTLFQQFLSETKVRGTAMADPPGK